MRPLLALLALGVGVLISPVVVAAEVPMVAKAIGDGYAVVLKNHGVVVAADSVENATIAAFALEETARLQWIASVLGTPLKISTGEVRSVLTGARKEEFFSHVWGHYEALDPWNKR